MRSIITTLGIIALLLAPRGARLFAQSRAIVIEGMVRTEEGTALALATIRALGGEAGCLSDNAGRFRLRVPINQGVAAITIEVRYVGYTPRKIDVDMRDRDSVVIDVTMKSDVIAMREVTVSSSALGAGGLAGTSLGQLDVLTTPGAAGDIYRALETLPGLVAIGDGSGLFVRGGEADETRTILDGAPVAHPYKYESPAGGTFGTIPPFLVDGVYFSSGGFPARYGDALSGALVLESMGMPDAWSLNGNLGLAAASIGIAAPLIGRKLGLRLSGNSTSTDLLFRVNGVSDRFTRTPGGADLNASLIYDYAPGGTIKLFNYATAEHVGVRAPLPSEGDAVYHSEETNRLHNLQWRDEIDGWRMEAGISANVFNSHSGLGVLDISTSDRTYHAHVDAEHSFTLATLPVLLRAGAEMERAESSIAGAAPVNPAVLDSGAATYALDEHYHVVRSGAYAEMEIAPARWLEARFGARADARGSGVTVDPRAGVRMRLANGIEIRTAWGVYHQTPSPAQLNAASGNPALRSERAEHRIIGAGYRAGDLLARIELYDKSYRDIILRDSISHLANRGTGFARGVDIFLKYGSFPVTRFNGWLSYSFLHSRRTGVRDLGERLAYEEALSPFDLPHALTLVGKYRVIGLLNIGATFKYQTGEPVTPIVGALPDTAHGTYLPIDGPLAGERLPDYLRLDADLSYLLPFADNAMAVFYVGITNLLDRDNILGYNYTRDYSSRTPQSTTFNRSVYLGATVTITL